MLFLGLRLRSFASALACLFLLTAAQVAHATFSLTFQGTVQTINTGGSITLSSPSGIVVDSAGDTFIADTLNGTGRIVEVNAQGTASVLTISGLSPALGSVSGIAIDGSGNLYIADTSNTQVVKVTSSGAGSVISTGAVTLTAPYGVAVDQSGDLFISDGTGGSSQIVEVTSGGAAAALAITVSSGASTLNSTKGLAVDVSGKLYIADSGNNRIVTVAPGSTTGVVFSIGALDPLINPNGVAVDRVGNVFIADTSNGRIVTVDTGGNGDVLLNSVFLQGTTLTGPLGVAVDVFGGVYVADTGDSRALVVDPSIGVDSSSSLNKTVVGFGHISLGSSTPTSFILNFSVGFPVESLGSVNAFTAGTQNLDFQIVSGANTTCSGAPSATYCTVQVSFLPTAPGLRNGALVLYDAALNPVLTVPLYGFGDAPIAALSPNTGSLISTGGVPLNFPFQIALDGAGNIYDANNGGNLVRIPAGGGSASVVSPTGYTFGSEVTGVALDGAGNLFVSDHNNNRILVITPGGVVSVLNITGLSPMLNLPTALAFDASGTLYISDYGSGRTVEVSSIQVTGSTSTGIGTVVGTGSYITSSEGNTGVAVDSMGNIYIPDGYAGSDPSRIIKVTAAGVVSLLTPTGITFSRPEGVGADAMGNIYVADAGNNRIVKITAAGVASVLQVSGLPAPQTLGSPFGVTVDPLGNLYIPDSGNNRLLFINVSGAPLTFPTSTGVGTTDTADGPQTATVTNLGNQPLVFSADPTYTADFSSNGNDTNLCTSSTSLSPGTACDVSVNFTPQSAGGRIAGINVANNTFNVPGSTEQVSVTGTGLNVSDSTATTVAVSPTSVVSGQSMTITATVADTAAGDTSNSPSGSVNFIDTVGSTITSLNNGASVNLTNKTASLNGVVLNGVGTHTITANYSGSEGQYTTSSGSATVMVGKASVIVAGPAQPVSLSPGQSGSATITVTASSTSIAAPSGSISYSILSASGTSVATGNLPLAMGNSGSTATVPFPNTLAPGSYTVSITYSGDSNYAVPSTATTISLSIGHATPTVTLTSNASSVILTNPLLFTTTVSSTTTTPTGTVSFLDGTTPLGEGTLSNGVAVLSTSSLSAGNHTITAVYSGDANFSAGTSGALSETVLDFSLNNVGGSGSGTTPSQTVAPGGTANYPLTLLPTNGTIFPAPITLSITGLPSGATATIAPATWSQLTATTWSFPANVALPSVTLAIQTPSTVARLEPGTGLHRTLPPVALGLLLLPLVGMRRRLGKTLGRTILTLFLLVAGASAMVGLSGCGTNSGFFGQGEKTYTVLITASSGSLSHSTSVTLTVQ